MGGCQTAAARLWPGQGQGWRLGMFICKAEMGSCGKMGEEGGDGIPTQGLVSCWAEAPPSRGCLLQTLVCGEWGPWSEEETELLGHPAVARAQQPGKWAPSSHLAGPAAGGAGKGLSV